MCLRWVSQCVVKCESVLLDCPLLQAGCIPTLAIQETRPSRNLVLPQGTLLWDTSNRHKAVNVQMALLDQIKTKCFLIHGKVTANIVRATLGEEKQPSFPSGQQSLFSCTMRNYVAFWLVSFWGACAIDRCVYNNDYTSKGAMKERENGRERTGTAIEQPCRYFITTTTTTTKPSFYKPGYCNLWGKSAWPNYHRLQVYDLISFCLLPSLTADLPDILFYSAFIYFSRPKVIMII